MIFQLGKKASADDEKVRQETFERWREASMRSQLQEGNLGHTSDAHSVEEIKVDTMQKIEWPEDKPLQVKTYPKVSAPSAPDEDRRPTVNLTQQIDIDQIEISQQPARINNFEQLQKNLAESLHGNRTTGPIQAASSQTVAPQTVAPQPIHKPSKLAQFVTSGLSAAGLVSSAPKTAEPVETRVEFQETVRPIVAEKKIQPTPPPPVIPLTPDEEVKQRYGSNVRSALGPGTIIEGTFSFDSPVCIEGTLLGEVRSNSVLIVGSQASVQARVHVGSLVVLGSVKGDVQAEELVDIKSGGSLEGDVRAERFAIQDGGWFQGKCTPTAPNKLLKAKQEKAVKEAERQANNVQMLTNADKWRIA